MSRLVLQNGTLFDSLTGNLIHNQTIAIERKKIEWVGTDHSFEKEDNDNIIDVNEKFN